MARSAKPRYDGDADRFVFDRRFDAEGGREGDA
jgi:hypothetical protein